MRTRQKKLGSNETVEWTHGILAGMDCLYPQAWAELLYKFEELSCDELMSRCSRQTTTNMNESIHQKLALLVHKCKSHTTERVEFGTGSLQMSQNFGYEKSSLLNVFGWMTESISSGLQHKDKLSVKSATRKHRLEEGKTHHHRRKRVCRAVDGERGSSRSGVGVNAEAGENVIVGVNSLNPDRVNADASGSGVNDGVSGSGVNRNRVNDSARVSDVNNNCVDEVASGSGVDEDSYIFGGGD